MTLEPVAVNSLTSHCRNAEAEQVHVKEVKDCLAIAKVLFVLVGASFVEGACSQKETTLLIVHQLFAC